MVEDEPRDAIESAAQSIADAGWSPLRKKFEVGSQNGDIYEAKHTRRS
jgi:hypothetical protein